MTDETNDAVDKSRRPAHSIMLRSVEWSSTTCKSCGARIRWAVTQAGKKMPVDVRMGGDAIKRLATGGYEVSSDHVHWATCPHAREHRRNSRTAPSERID